MTLLQAYNNRALFTSLKIDGLGACKFTGITKGGGASTLIQVEHNGRTSMEQGNCTCTVKDRYKGNSPVPSIVKQLDKNYNRKTL